MSRLSDLRWLAGSSPAWSWLSSLSFHAFVDVWRGLGPADVCDILVVSVLLYLGLRALTQARVARVAQGVGLLGVLYLIATQSGMVLTVAIFRRFFTVLLMAMVVIFQEELRRFFERLTVWPRRSKGSPSARHSARAVADVAMTCALGKIGALIVLKGRDPLDRHVSGGHRLGGELCSPLLESLFDPHSEGHDGAVLVEGNVVTHFGVHLPLTPHPEQTGGRGTRHAAGLGLSEVTDALCVIVSEQKGTISLASNGVLTTLTNSRKGLETQLRAFLEEKALSPAEWGWFRTLGQHASFKILAGALGIGLWLVFVRGIRPMEQSFQIPVRVHNLDGHLHLRHLDPMQVTVRLSGLKRDFVQLRSTPLRVFLDLDEVGEGTQEVPITEENVDAPDPLRVVSVEPATVRFELMRAASASGTAGTGGSSRLGLPRAAWFHFR